MRVLPKNTFRYVLPLLDKPHTGSISAAASLPDGQLREIYCAYSSREQAGKAPKTMVWVIVRYPPTSLSLTCCLTLSIAFKVYKIILL